MKTTICAEELRGLGACEEGYQTFLAAHGEEDVSLSDALESNGIKDVCWLLNKLRVSPQKEKDLRDFARGQASIHVEKTAPYCSAMDYALICAWVLEGDEGAKIAAKRAAGRAADAADSAARSAAGSVAMSVAMSAAGSVAMSAACSVVDSAARSAAGSVAWSAAWSAVDSTARSAAWSAVDSTARSAAWSAAESAARSAAWSAAESAFKNILISWESKS